MDIASRIAAYGGHSIIETTLGMSDSKAWKAFVTWFMGLAIIFTGLGFMAEMRSVQPMALQILQHFSSPLPD